MRLSIVLMLSCLIHNMPIQAQAVKTSGAARNVMMGTDLSSTVQLDTLLQAKHMFALGPVHDLQGEITSFDGVPYTSWVNDSAIAVKIDSTVRAPFLAYSYVDKWISIGIEASIATLEDITSLIDSLATVHGFDTDTAFPFRLQAIWDRVDFHIIMRDTMEAEHNHARHEQAKQKFTDHAISADLIGFFSRHHEGVFTHRGQFIHVHYLREDRSAAGHLDGLVHRGSLIIFLPE